MIILVEDSTTQRIKLKQSLVAAGFQDVLLMPCAENLFKVLGEKLKPQSVDLILIDNELPGMNGIEAAKKLKSNAAFKDIPLIMLTASESLKTLEIAFDVGINDYLQKPVKRLELLARIRSMQRLKKEMDARKSREKQLRNATHKLKKSNEALSSKEQQLLKLPFELKQLSENFKRQARQDGLTGLANRRYFDQMVRKLWQKAYTNQTPLSMIVLDVDAFKKYNDSYGHAKGDDCLVAVAKILKSPFPNLMGFVARYGGEEFVISLPGSCLERANALAETLRQAIEDQAIPHKASPSHNVVTASFGVASLIPKTGETYEKLLQIADQALYLAKENGRNRVHVSTAKKEFV